MKELVNRFAQVRRDLLETVSGFPADRIEEALCGEWDIKCVLAHIAGWDTYFTKIVNLLRIGEDVPYWGDIEEFNEASYQRGHQRADLVVDAGRRVRIREERRAIRADHRVELAAAGAGL